MFSCPSCGSESCGITVHDVPWPEVLTTERVRMHGTDPMGEDSSALSVQAKSRHEWRRGIQTLSVIVFFVLAAAAWQFVISNGVFTSGGNARTGSVVPNDHGGGATRNKAYADTTCGDWNTVMSDGQKRTMTGDALTAMRQREGVSSPIPSTSQLESMMSAVDVVCADPAGAGTNPIQMMAFDYTAQHALYSS